MHSPTCVRLRCSAPPPASRVRRPSALPEASFSLRPGAALALDSATLVLWTLLLAAHALLLRHVRAPPPVALSHLVDPLVGAQLSAAALSVAVFVALLSAANDPTLTGAAADAAADRRLGLLLALDGELRFVFSVFANRIVLPLQLRFALVVLAACFSAIQVCLASSLATLNRNITLQKQQNSDIQYERVCSRIHTYIFLKANRI